LSLSARLQEIRTGFHPAFWVANLTELFERLAFYGQQAVLALFLSQQLKLSSEQTGALMGYFGFAVFFLPVLGGALADRFGFRRMLSFAYLVLTLGYFLLGSLSAGWMAPARNIFSPYWLVFGILLITALGPSFVKPCVVGTTAVASSENVRSLGFSIYYTLVNVGGMLGPLLASVVVHNLGLGREYVFYLSSSTAFLMFLVTVLYFREPERAGKGEVSSVGQALGNIFRALLNWRFVLFLLVFSGYWVVFWQQYISLPLYIHDYVSPDFNIELLLSVDGATVIVLQIAVSMMTRKIPTFAAMTLGTLITGASWLLLTLGNSTWLFVAALVVLALGEMTQSPRYYEYISRLAPPGQQGLYMGTAFLPIAIGYLIAGRLGGYLVYHYGEVLHRPKQMWLVVTGVGIATTLLMLVYDRIFKPGAAVPPPSA
jgi:POT family proton-dependent oligopeptide transporter